MGRVIVRNLNPEAIGEGETIFRKRQQSGGGAQWAITATCFRAWAVDRGAVEAAERDGRQVPLPGRPQYLLHQDPPDPGGERLSCYLYALESYDESAPVQTCWAGHGLSGFPLSRIGPGRSKSFRTKSLLALETASHICEIISIHPKGGDSFPARIILGSYLPETPLHEVVPAGRALDFLPAGDARDEAQRAYESLEKALRTGTDWSLVALASRRVLEKTLFATLIAKGIAPASIEKANLYSLIERSVEVGILATEGARYSAHLIRSHGATDHPGRSRRQGSAVDRADALAAANGLASILRSSRAALA
ncbi:MAG: hypothetical protein O7H41_11445 [Planctomycetota bacterium]|nr:hypothetical protein [Planctomycetota bacterium]